VKIREQPPFWAKRVDCANVRAPQLTSTASLHATSQQLLALETCFLHGSRPFIANQSSLENTS